MTRVALIVGASALVAFTLPSGALGAGATYEVIQCHPGNRGHGDALLHEPRPYGVTTACANPSAENAIQINNRLRAEKGREGSVRWAAPADTGIVGIRVDAKLRRAAGHRARLFMADQNGRETRRIAQGDGSPGAFHIERWRGNRQAQFVAELGCDEDRGCEESNAAKTWVRGLRLTLADYADPEIVAGGSAVDPGWRLGRHGLQYTADDAGSGLRRVVVRVNGVSVEDVEADCPGAVTGSELAARLQPCGPFLTGVDELDTSGAPFTEGQNGVSVCAVDFAGNQACDVAYCPSGQQRARRRVLKQPDCPTIPS